MKLGSLVLAALCSLLAAPGVADAQPAVPSSGPRLDGPLVVVNAPDAKSWVRLLRASGASARVGTFDEAMDRQAAVISSDARLSPQQLQRLRSRASAGERIVSSNDAVIKQLGLTRVAARTVTTARMAGLEGDATWAAPMQVRPLQGGALAALATSGDAVLVGIASLGRGELLAVGADPFGDNKSGYELFPLLGRVAADFGGAPAGPTRIGGEVYLDPGILHDGVAGTPEQLANRLAGARAVHVAGWNGDAADPKSNYNYQALIDALHARGILVYAWLEPPFVSERFWTEHPECREKTATGRDAFVDWRRLIALEDRRCFALAMPVYTHVVSSFSFDGVDVGELFFEPDSNRDNYTPFHPSALAQFGKDPNADPAGFRQFRTKLVTALNKAVLQVLNDLPNARQLDFKLTVLNSNLDPAFGDEVGSDVDALAQVANETNATIQVEDPFSVWTQSPLRFDTVAPQVNALAPGGLAYPAIKVVDRGAGHPTRTMTGAELDLAVSSAAQGAGLVGLYSAGTISPTDLPRLPGALAGTTSVTDAGYTSSWTVIVSAPGGSAFRRLTVDGRQWPVSAAGTAVVPAGNHKLKWSRGSAKGPGLARFTGELAAASLTGRSMTLHYDSRAVAYAVIDQRPLDRESVASPDGGFTVKLPSGRQTITMNFKTVDRESTSGRPILYVVVGLLAIIAVVWLIARRRPSTRT